jgi:hypothetical protein
LSLVRSYKCDGCGRALAGGRPVLNVMVTDTTIEGGGGGRRRRRAVKRSRFLEREAIFDFCGDCRTKPLPVGALLDAEVPPMKDCEACGGIGELGTGSGDDTVWTECPKCLGAGEVSA